MYHRKAAPCALMSPSEGKVRNDVSLGICMRLLFPRLTCRSMIVKEEQNLLRCRLFRRPGIRVVSHFQDEVIDPRKAVQ